MPQSRSALPPDLETTLDPTHVARLLDVASAYLLAAFQLLQCREGSEPRYATQAHIYLAREEIDAAVTQWQDQTASEGAP